MFMPTNRRIYLPVALVFLLFSRCSSNSFPFKITITKIDSSHSPVNQEYADMELVVEVVNTSMKQAEFDLVTAVFYLNHQPICAAIYIAGISFGKKTFIGYHSSTGKPYAPGIQPNLSILIPQDGKKVLKLQTANAPYIELDPKLKKKLMLQFYLHNKPVYGPYKIPIIME